MSVARHPRDPARTLRRPGPGARRAGAAWALLLAVVVAAPAADAEAARRPVLSASASVAPHQAPAPVAAPVAPAATSPVDAETPWVRPVPGPLLRPFDPPVRRWSAGHRGVDLAAPGSTTVRAPAPGTVVFAGAVAGKPVVVVAHPGGLRSTFEPAAATVPVGTRVGSGDAVARRAAGGDGVGAGAGHCGTRRCLHWGVLRGDAYLDPMAFLGEDAPIVLLPVRPTS
ncbi:murein hydrolase activator EnvC [Isoptericola sp. BMS4]|uniref:murein hydrolase activator EnvC family protein n=1 Tax=Isoptericola sp. BMS4 TaxID=2527875 RepID=UPI00141FEB6B|nr:M23 family metallopeptidase [Isoptericola sp. BMS4]